MNRAFLTRCLANYGVAPGELAALGAAPLHPLPDALQGFGLIGDPGTGKTWLVVQWLARFVDQHIAGWVFGQRPLEIRPMWVHWPQAAEEMKRLALGGDMGASWSARARAAAVLVLDDLGRERVKGEADFSRAILVEVLDHRERYRLPVVWTSNASADELAAIYRGPLASRLLGTWPPFRVDGQDMRLAKVSGGDR